MPPAAAPTAFLRAIPGRTESLTLPETVMGMCPCQRTRGQYWPTWRAIGIGLPNAGTQSGIALHGVDADSDRTLPELRRTRLQGWRVLQHVLQPLLQALRMV